MNPFTPKLFTLIKNGCSKADLRVDAMAGLTVAVVALPLAMALAIASGASPEKGLVTAVVAGLIVSLIGGSRVQIGGPTGAFVVVVFNVIATHGYDGLLIATLMAGVFLIVAGYAGMGQVIKYIPHPVVTGFTAGIAIIIASSQVKDFLGLRIENSPVDFLSKWIVYFDAWDTISLPTLCVGIFVLAILICLRYLSPKLPSFLIAILISSILVYLFQIPVETIGSRFPNMAVGLPMPELPVFDIMKCKAVMPSALTIAFLAGIEALLSATVADGMTGFKHRPNQELVGQGVANMASALFAGLPATGALARTATNIKAGGKTPVAGACHALFLLVFMLIGMDVMKFVPMAALAAVLFIVAWSMSEFDHFVHIFRLSRTDRAVMVLTFLLTIFLDLTIAIGVGVTLACLLFMKHMAESVEIKSECQTSGPSHNDNHEYEKQRIDLPEGVEVFQITGPFFFGVASDLVDIFKAMGQMPKILILRMRLVPYLDATGENVLVSMINQCRDNGMTVILSGLQSQPLKMIKKARFEEDKERIIFCIDYETALSNAKMIIKSDS